MSLKENNHYDVGNGDLLQNIISNNSRIRELVIEDGVVITENMLYELLHSCTELEVLRVKKTDFKTFVIPFHPNLRVIDFSGNKTLEQIGYDLGDDGQAVVEEVNLSECHNVTPTTGLFSPISSTLKKLSLKSNSSLEDDDVESYIEHWANLEILDLSEYAQSHGLTDKTARLISQKLPNLRELRLSRMKGLSDDGIERISRLFNLTTLVIDGCPKLTFKGLQFLKNMTGLTTLDISRNNKMLGFNEQEGIEFLSNMNLRSLTVSFMGLKEPSILLLAEKLVIFRPTWQGTINDFVMKDIGKKVNVMEELDVTSCKRITDFGVMDMVRSWKRNVPPLKRFTIRKHGERLTRKSIDFLKGKWPDCEVCHDL